MQSDQPDKDAETVEVDARGLNCPMPLLKTKQALNKLSDGDMVRVLATDPGSFRDLQVFAAQSGHELMKSESIDRHFVYLIRKKGN